MLINAGTDTEIKNKNGYTPFNLADQQHHESVEEILQEFTPQRIVRFLNKLPSKAPSPAG
jgi:hypothetical protein